MIQNIVTRLRLSNNLTLITKGHGVVDITPSGAFQQYLQKHFTRVLFCFLHYSFTPIHTVSLDLTDDAPPDGCQGGVSSRCFGVGVVVPYVFSQIVEFLQKPGLY